MKYLVKFLFVIFIIALTTKMITNNRKHCNSIDIVNSIDSTQTMAIDSTQTITDTIKIK